MRRRLSYANVAATLALVLAMSGGAYAAGRYLINSTKQINPKVLRKLRGARGPAGLNGLVGPQGIAGREGPKGGRGVQGEPGFSALSQLPREKTESGEVTLSASAAAGGEAFSTSVGFPVQLAEPIPAADVEFSSVVTHGPHCLGPGTAMKGWLCVYISSETNVAPGPVSFDPEAAETAGSGKFGAGFRWSSTAAGPVLVTGTWSVTAP